MNISIIGINILKVSLNCQGDRLTWTSIKIVKNMVGTKRVIYNSNYYFKIIYSSKEPTKGGATNLPT